MTKGDQAMLNINNKIKHKMVMVTGVFFFMYAGILQADTKVLGWIEDAALTNKHFVVNAKLDTGADSSSLNAVNPEIVERGEDNYIKFKVVNRHGQAMEFDEKIVRWTRIKNKFGVKHKRPVIMLDVCIANVSRHVEVNLVDRSNYKYQLLIGRSFLKGKPNILIDSALKNSQQPACAQ